MPNKSSQTGEKKTVTSVDPLRCHILLLSVTCYLMILVLNQSNTSCCQIWSRFQSNELIDASISVTFFTTFDTRLQSMLIVVDKLFDIGAPSDLDVSLECKKQLNISCIISVTVITFQSWLFYRMYISLRTIVHRVLPQTRTDRQLRHLVYETITGSFTRQGLM